LTKAVNSIKPRKAKSFSVDITFLNEVSARPSSQISEIIPQFDNAGFITHNMSIDSQSAIDGITELARELDLSTHVYTYSTSFPAKEIINLSKEKSYDFIFLGYPVPLLQLQEIEKATILGKVREVLNGVRSISEKLVDQSLKHIFGFADQLPGGQTVQAVLDSVDAPIGVFVDKGLSQIREIGSIAFVYTGQIYEIEALTLVLNGSTATTVITNQPLQDFSPEVLQEHPNITMENSDNPLESVVQTAKTHDLLLLALPRGWWKNDLLAIKMTNIILSCPISILTVYPTITDKRYLRKATNINIVKSDPSDKPAPPKSNKELKDKHKVNDKESLIRSDSLNV